MSDEVPFSQTLRHATREGHDRAQESTFVTARLDGNLSLAGYTELVTQHYIIYAELEAAADTMREHPVVGAFVINALHRLPALTADLHALLGPTWSDHTIANTATTAYRDRLATVAANEPTAFVAHQYTRYLGDIAGGQIIRARLRRQHGLGDDGTRFYDFAAIEPIPTFRAHYRSLLDNAAWTAEERAALVAEARLAFDLNLAVFAELGESLDKYLVA